jgi:hypothetical protein
MNKLKLGVILGILAGIIDLIPMIFQGLSLEADISAFFFWIVAGFFISTSEIKLKGILKGVIISLILLVPLAFIIGWQEPASLFPVIIMNFILGALLGFLIDKWGKRK